VGYVNDLVPIVFPLIVLASSPVVWITLEPSSALSAIKLMRQALEKPLENRLEGRVQIMG